MNYDPWRGVVSRNGIPGDELISGLQKSIRRGNADIAIDLAYEMYITSEQLEDKLWRRLMAISVEDIGFGNVEASRVVYTLNCIRKEFPYDDGDRPLFFMYAIRFLCACEKERSTDCIKNLVMKKFNEGYVPEVPDYAYDMHTGKGRDMGRDVEHFLMEASRVTPEASSPLCDDRYRQQLLEKVRKDRENPPEQAAEHPMNYSEWQY